jgi:GT2 family glycosyltransferase
MVSYNTRELTLKALETLYETTLKTPFDVIVFDNASHDGSADAIADRFPHVMLVRSERNIGFAAGNNEAIRRARSNWLLLLNPDTECRPYAIDNLLAFATANPKAGIYGGRTVFPDGSLNKGSCWNKITLWSLFCSAAGLTALFPNSSLFNPELIAGWNRDNVREVDIVSGCFFLITHSLWQELGGFDLRFFMYGEEADLCLRAQQKGYRPLVTPDAEIIHLVGASIGKANGARKMVLLAKGRVTLIRKHWRGVNKAMGLSLYYLWGSNRFGASLFASFLNRKKFGENSKKWSEVWRDRANWLMGYN